MRNAVHGLRLAAATAMAAVLLAGCSSLRNAGQLVADCPKLAGRIVPPAGIGLASGPARVTSAVLVPAAAASGAAPATPQMCRVLGEIAPVGATAQPIRFQLNLPTTWNGKALQYGGGGFNGVLVTGLAPLRDAAPSDPLPVTRGYATFGTDSGHQASAWPAGEPGAFTLDDEMLENFAYASYKKVRDVAAQLVHRYYGTPPARMYYFGGSEGGREGLAMAQRFPRDYDGIVSVVPVINWTGLFHAFVRNQLPQFGDWLEPAKSALVARAVAQACDALDGLADGVVNNPLACQPRVDLRPLRCPDGNDAGAQCLSDAELALLRSIHSPFEFPFSLANGITVYPPWLYGHEDSPDGTAAHLARWVSGTAPPAVPPDAARNSVQWLYGSNWIRYAIARDSDFDVRNYRIEYWRARVLHTSGLMDATNPDLSAFFAKGGKLIVRENAGDRAQSALMGIHYVDAVRARVKPAVADASMRLYVSPSSTHAGSARVVGGQAPVPTMVDLLDPLDRWVEKGTAPPDALVQVVQAPRPPFAVQASRPLCRHPGYPHYVRGDRLQASSYECRTPQP